MKAMVFARARARSEADLAICMIDEQTSEKGRGSTLNDEGKAHAGGQKRAEKLQEQLGAPAYARAL